MQIIIAVLLSFAAVSSANAQGALSPQELATQVQTIIQSKNIDRIAQFIQPETDPASIANFKSDLATYIGAENLSVYIVPKDDQEAVKKFISGSPIPGALKPLDDRVKKYADAGRFFNVSPLGDLVISGQRLGGNSKRSMSSVVYGQSNGKYIIIFARKK